WRADEAIGVVMGFIEKTPNTLLITTADSEAGGLQIVSVKEPKRFEEPLPSMIENGAPLDGRDGKDSLPFVALT
ncbi:MAG: alkaline phosphatase, partial [candidate division Zixibacteria bacterium]|nr:alkaline phosphatase [Gammaproteobacteria bacterium]NIR48762.1 alkaline phosphatase [candidate division KSB1 bacterium]NIR64103.1 alkaline phosphatase [candidate division Zixibacteria bacterium]NIS46001.1 alkaline phosphatase [candidate division Zixibacteria bacterium]NIT71218.1 alkaline phosphatase [candidate division KSB1 bacterium]